MTNKKHYINVKRIVTCVAAVIVILCTLGVVANAATDGAVTEAISNVAETFSKKVHVFVNGEAIDVDVNVEEHTGEDGSTYFVGEISVTEPNGDPYSKIEFEIDGSEDDTGLGEGEFDIRMYDTPEGAGVDFKTK